MSTLETNAIGKYSTNNVSIDDALNLKSYDTAGRDGLSSPQAGDTIYNSQTGTIDYYNGTAWFATSDSTFVTVVDFLVIAGGGGGAGNSQVAPGGGGGAGGYRSSYNSETSGGGGSSETALTITDNTNVTVTIGAGGAPDNSAIGQSPSGNDSVFSTVTSLKGGGAAPSGTPTGTVGSGGGSGSGSSSSQAGTANQGYAGGGGHGSSGYYGGGGGGGAGANGGNATAGQAGHGGNGVASTITNTPVTRAGGGGGGKQGGTATGNGGSGGGGAAQSGAGTINTGSGGGGNGNASAAGAGGSGIVILSYPSTKTISFHGGASSSAGEQTVGSRKYVEIQTSGTVSFS